MINIGFSCSSADLCVVRLTAALAGALTRPLLEHRQKEDHCLHHYLVEGAGDQIVHKTDEAKGERRVGFTQNQLFSLEPRANIQYLIHDSSFLNISYTQSYL